ncbi:MAG: hypothetical protein ACOYIK_00080 [Coriobacteriales bacterium]|jgi:hypothetical protein
MENRLNIGKKWKVIACAALAMVFALSLSACGSSDSGSGSGSAGSGSGSGSGSTSQTASEAFSNGGIWYVSYGTDGVPEKDTVIREVLVFEDGMVTPYPMNWGATDDDLTYGDLDGLSDDEIIDYVKNFHRSNFDYWIEKTKEDNSDDSTTLALLDSATYQAPEPVSYELRVKTDGTGNNTEEETIVYTHNLLDLVNENSVYDPSEEKLSFDASTGVSTVYDNLFAGFTGDYDLYTIVSSEEATFTLDSPDSNGVTVED